MSGDGFNGYYSKLVFNYDISSLEDMRAMRDYCIDNARLGAATHIQSLIDDAEAFRNKVDNLGGVIRAIAWAEDGDSGLEYIDTEMAKLTETVST